MGGLPSARPPRGPREPQKTPRTQNDAFGVFCVFCGSPGAAPFASGQRRRLPTHVRRRRQSDALIPSASGRAPSMYIVVGGAGEVGYHVARSLREEGHDVAVVESDPKRIERMQDLDVVVVQGNMSGR